LVRVGRGPRRSGPKRNQLVDDTQKEKKKEKNVKEKKRTPLGGGGPLCSMMAAIAER